MNFEHRLPDDIICQILQYADINTIFNYCLTSKYHYCLFRKTLYATIEIVSGTLSLFERRTASRSHDVPVFQSQILRHIWLHRAGKWFRPEDCDEIRIESHLSYHQDLILDEKVQEESEQWPTVRFIMNHSGMYEDRCYNPFLCPVLKDLSPRNLIIETAWLLQEGLLDQNTRKQDRSPHRRFLSIDRPSPLVSDRRRITFLIKVVHGFNKLIQGFVWTAASRIDLDLDFLILEDHTQKYDSTIWTEAVVKCLAEIIKRSTAESITVVFFTDIQSIEKEVKKTVDGFNSTPSSRSQDSDVIEEEASQRWQRIRFMSLSDYRVEKGEKSFRRLLNNPDSLDT